MFKFWKKNKSPSTFVALTKLVDKEVYKQALGVIEDKRFIFDYIADKIGITPDHLLGLLGQELGIGLYQPGTFATIPPFPVVTESLLNLGCWYLWDDDAIVGIVCIDPLSAEQALRAPLIPQSAKRVKKVSYFLASMQTINRLASGVMELPYDPSHTSNTLTVSEEKERHSAPQGSQEKEKATISDTQINQVASFQAIDKTSLGYQTISKLAQKILEYGTFSFTITYTDKGLEYEFTTKDGQSLCGTILSKATKATLDFLHMHEGLEIERQTYRISAASDILWQIEASSGHNDPYTAEMQNASRHDVRPRKASLAKPSNDININAELTTLTTKPQQQTTPDSERKRIVIFEDSETFSKVLHRFLKDKYEIKVMLDEPELAQNLRQELPAADLFISDFHMRYHTGKEIVASIKSHSKDLPIILLTSSKDESVELELVELGINCFLNKDKDPRILRAYIENILK